MLNPEEIDISILGDHRTEVLNQAKIELRMNLSLLGMLKGNTPLEDFANLRERWVEMLKRLVRILQSAS